MSVPDALTIIRNRTTDDAAWLSDAKITEIVAQYEGNVDLATAEALMYMSRRPDFMYNSVSRGGISVSGPTLQAKAAYYQAQGAGTLTQEVTSASLQSAKMVRTDLYPTPDVPEYSA